MNREALLKQDEVIRLVRDHIADAATASRIVEWVESLESSRRETSRLFKRARFDHRTMLEIVGQISRRGLDIQGLEGYLLSSVRGHFGVLQVFLMRRTDLEDGMIQSFPSPARRIPDLGLHQDGTLGRLLLEARKPLRLSSGELPKEARRVAEEGLVLLVPLVHSGEDEGDLLEGVLCIGKKVTGTEFTDEDLEMLGFLGEVTGIALHNAHLYQRSITDGLTRICSRSHFDLVLEQKLEEARNLAGDETRTVGRNLSLIMTDLDHFKEVNDSYGHQVGDQVLIEVADRLGQGIRKSDLLARYGGEEFVFVLPGACEEEALMVAERLREAIEAREVEIAGCWGIKVTASFGTATFPKDALEGRGLVRLADRALYQAKAEGRNRIVQASGLVDWIEGEEHGAT